VWPNGFLWVAIAVVAVAACSADEPATERCLSTLPASQCIDRIDEIPDYTQTDPAYGGFQPDGDNFCGPASVSNSLMWLSDHGFPNLAPRSTDRTKDQHDLIALLASSAYFGTNGAQAGTPPPQLLSGLKAYFTDRNTTYLSLQWQGAYPLPIPAEFDTGIEIPQIEWIKRGAEGSSSLWLLLALATYETATDTFVVSGGHYVTLVGHGHDGTRSDPSDLIVHDPYTSGQSNGYAHAELITSGQMRVELPPLPTNQRSAVGYYRLTGPFHFSQPETLLVGAVRLDMPCP
jgi:hypothetical protein